MKRSPARPTHHQPDDELAALIAGASVIYLRRDKLSPADQRDLDAYTELLRGYYEIPKGEPVFPEIEDTPERAAEEARPRPKKAAGINRVDHPWRVHL